MHLSPAITPSSRNSASIRVLLGCVAAIAFFGVSLESRANEAIFFRALNLNGPSVPIDGRAWDGKDAGNFSFKGNVFENQSVALKPPTDAGRTQMIRSSVWGSDAQLEVKNVPAGTFQVFLYVWEDNHNERFDILLNGAPVLEGFHSGTAGMWKRLGPWKCESVDGKIKVSAKGGAANLSGLEIWSGDGAIPALPVAGFNESPTSEQLAFFESKVRPLLVDRCYECHSANAKKVKGGLLLDSRAGLRKGGDTGPAITPGDPDASLFIQAVRHSDKDLAMPPKKMMPREQILELEEWVKMGAPDPRTDNTVATIEAKNAIDWNKAREWWSLRPLASVQPPSVANSSWPVNAVDHFVLEKLERAGLEPAADAEKRVLIRRATYDLIGLPPTPQEVEAFLADDSPNAFERVVDRLLASPHYGERWGRYWLDVVRYADTAGDNSDFPIPQMHRYRDWVIAAFNRDLPYDQFVRQQLAGDLLPAANDTERYEQIVATGYIANARRFGSRVDDYPQHLTIEDTIDNFGRAFLGLTINCARCHDHKFDPITTQDYYALYGIFHSTRYPWPGIELDQKQRDFVPLTSNETVASVQKERADKQASLNAEVKRLEGELKGLEGEAKKPVEEQLKKAKEAVEKHGRTPPSYALAYAVGESKKREDVAVQMKGDPAKPGPVVRRHFLTVLGGAELPVEDGSSGRLQLANWLLDSKDPLPARVMANRIWLYHFGKGIVPTPNDFGKQGKPASHPELLDWLASRFIAEGWSIKKMHRLIMLSRTYQLSSAREADALAKDANNDLLSAYPRRRLDAEAIRDTLLALGGSLDRIPGGAHPFPSQTEWKFTQHNPFKATYETNKRSVYLMTQRIQRHPYLAIFDGADPSVSTPQRTLSTTPLQSLYFLNDPLVHEQAKRFAQRLISERSDNSGRLQLASELAFVRAAGPNEIERAEKFLAAARAQLSEKVSSPDELELESWQALVRVLFRLNEFVYLD
jgi:hypothetical protein